MENFIRPSDYKTLIQADHLEQILNDLVEPDYVLNQAELAAETEVKSYLNGKYDVDAIFIQIDDWIENADYLQGEYVWYEDKVYTAQSDIIPSDITPDEDPEWLQKDPRNARLLQCLVDIVLYHIHSRISPRNIPQLRLTRYDQCTEWLTNISKGNVSVGLPPLEDPQFKPRVSSVYLRNNWFWNKQIPNIKITE